MEVWQALMVKQERISLARKLWLRKARCNHTR